MISIFIEYLPAWNADINVEFSEITSSYYWPQDGITLEYVISEIKSRYATQRDQHGNPWEITKIEKYKGDDSECQFDWLLIVRYNPVSSVDIDSQDRSNLP